MHSHTCANSVCVCVCETQWHVSHMSNTSIFSGGKTFPSTHRKILWIASSGEGRQGGEEEECGCFQVRFDVIALFQPQIDTLWHNKCVYPALTSSTRTRTTESSRFCCNCECFLQSEHNWKDHRVLNPLKWLNIVGRNNFSKITSKKTKFMLWKYK